MSVWPSVSVILRESGRSTMAGLEGREGVTGRCDKSSSAHLSPLSVTSWWRWDREMLQTVRCIHEWLVYTSLEWKPEAVLWPVIHDTPPLPPLLLPALVYQHVLDNFTSHCATESIRTISHRHGGNPRPSRFNYASMESILDSWQQRVVIILKKERIRKGKAR